MTGLEKMLELYKQAETTISFEEFLHIHKRIYCPSFLGLKDIEDSIECSHGDCCKCWDRTLKEEVQS